MLFDLSAQTQFELTGPDRAKFLHGFCTNDIKSLTPGRGCEAFVCNIQGKVLGHIFVFATENSLWVESVPGQEDLLFAHWDRYHINEDVQILRRTHEFTVFYLEGALPDPLSAARNLIEQPLLSHTAITVGEAVLHVRKVDWLGNTGWLISSPHSIFLPEFMTEAVSDPQVFNSLRIEAGFPLFGVDITNQNLAQEVNRTACCISFHKGCYLGQEPIARIDALGHVNRELHRIKLSGTDIPAPGALLTNPHTGTPVGEITSAAQSAREADQVVALAYLRPKFCLAGEKLAIQFPSGQQLAEVC